MRRLILGLCIFSAACGSQSSSSPTAPSAFTITPPPQISSALAGSPIVEVTFTKWITTFPGMAGFTGGDVVGTYAGEVLSRTPFDNGVIVQLDARYEVTDSGGLHSFTTIIQGKSTKGNAVLNGVITEGWMLGARTHVTFETITPCQSGTMNVCFRGTIRIMPASAT
ncbi:MAG: hypothetical protein ABW318_04425 [Vicinamibacterales bacterium]